MTGWRIGWTSEISGILYLYGSSAHLDQGEVLVGRVKSLAFYIYMARQRTSIRVRCGVKGVMYYQI